VLENSILALLQFLRVTVFSVLGHESRMNSWCQSFSPVWLWHWWVCLCHIKISMQWLCMLCH